MELRTNLTIISSQRQSASNQSPNSGAVIQFARKNNDKQNSRDEKVIAMWAWQPSPPNAA